MIRTSRKSRSRSSGLANSLNSLSARIVAVLALIGFSLLGLLGSGAAQAATRPNVVLIQTDDQTYSLLRANYRDDRGRIAPVMPNIRALMINQGTEFSNYYSSAPICGPSRASLLSGQVPHNSRVVTNTGQFGGWEGWANSHIYTENMAVRLQEGGYPTAHFGKLTNWYGDAEAGPTGVPPGWDSWGTDVPDDSTRAYYGYYQYMHIERNNQDEIVGPLGTRNYGLWDGVDPESCSLALLISSPCNYHSDRISWLAADEIAAISDPFYIQVDYHAPHADDVAPHGPQPATRHIGLAGRAELPGVNAGFRNSNFNERNTADKSFLTQRENGLMKPGNIRNVTNSYRSSVESLQAVDEGVGLIYRTLRDTGKLDNTYVIFTSDNGYFYGDHRFMWGKGLAYEESARMPLVVTGPGVPERRIARFPGTTVDIAPTVLDITGVGAGNLRLDGVSLERGWRAPASKPRRVQLIEYLHPGDMRGEPDRVPEKPYRLRSNRSATKSQPDKHTSIKVGNYKYIDYDKGGNELYDLVRDPGEMYNQINNPGYRGLQTYLERTLQRWRSCAGASCNADPGRIPSARGFTRSVDYLRLR